MKIQYKNKIAIDLDPSIPEVNKVTDGNMNEIKNVVNTNADLLDGLNEQVTEYTNGVDDRLGNIESDIDNINSEIDNITDDLSNTYTKTEVDNLLSDKVTETSLNEEITNRENADINLQNQIDGITASSDVVDIVGTYQELLNYDTQHLGDNDIIKVLNDSTHNNATSYFRWDKQTETWTYIGSQGPFYTKGETDELLTGYVQKVEGKGLSTNDFTNELKSKLEGIESGAEVNKIETIKVNNVTQPITNKSVNIAIPTKTSDLNNDNGFITKSVSDLDNYYTKTQADNKFVDLKGKIQENKNQLDYLFSKSIQYKDNSKIQYRKYYSNSNLQLSDNAGYSAVPIENIPAGTYYYDLRITAALCYIKNIVTGEIKKLSEIGVTDNPNSETRTITVNYDFSLYISMNGNENSTWINSSMFANNTLPSKYVYRYYNITLNDMFNTATNILKLSVDMNSKKIEQVFTGDYQFLDKTQFDFGHYYTNENLNKNESVGYSTINILNLLPGTYYWKNCTLVPGLSYIKNLETNEMTRMDRLSPAVPTAQQDEEVNYTFNFPFSLYISVTGSQYSVWLQRAMFANNRVPSNYIYGFYNTNITKEHNIIVGSSASADYSSIKTAVNAISLQANSSNIYNIMLEDGTYNEVNITLPSYVNIIGISGNKEDVIIAGYLPETSSDADISGKSTFNISGSNKFKNVTITGQNVRYPVHSESSGSVKDWTQIVENCFIEHKGNQEVIDYRIANNLDYSGVWKIYYAWGEGASSGAYAKFENTTFKSVATGGRAFYIHEAENMEKPYYHILKNCTFDLKGVWGVQVCENRSGNRNNTIIFEDCNFLYGCGLFVQGTYPVNIIITNCGLFPFYLQNNLYDSQHFPKFTGEYTRLKYVGEYQLTGGEFLKYVNNATEVDVASSTDNPKLIAGYCVGTPDDNGYVDVCQHKVYPGYVNQNDIVEIQINNSNHKLTSYSSGNKIGVSYPNGFINLKY